MRSILTILVTVALGIAGAYFLLRGDDSPAPTGTQPRAGVDAPSQPPAAPMQGTAPERKQARVRKPRMLRFPDGTELPPLNGVEIPAKLQWPKNRPYSPVVGKKTEANGDTWYVHADGTRSTTIMLYRSDLNREDPTTIVANPEKVQPRVDDTDKSVDAPGDTGAAAGAAAGGDTQGPPPSRPSGSGT